MLAPTEKTNDIIQFCVTRKCTLFNCSNCTQLLPFRRDAKEMSPEVFREGLRATREWPGVLAMFGGTPCAHSQFPLLCKIMAEEIPDQRKRGLWTNSLCGHGEIARETFYPLGRFNLNVHGEGTDAEDMRKYLPNVPVYGMAKSSWHSPVMMDRRDFGMPDAEWIALRENCDINQKWSSAIVERNGKPFAYFCEVAAAMDGVRGENHGIPAVDGWWRFRMDRFADQVTKCCDRGCGVPLKLRGHVDRDDTYDVSQSLVSLTVRAKRVSVKIHETPPNDKVTETTDYQRLRT